MGCLVAEEGLAAPAGISTKFLSLLFLSPSSFQGLKFVLVSHSNCTIQQHPSRSEQIILEVKTILTCTHVHRAWGVQLKISFFFPQKHFPLLECPLGLVERLFEESLKTFISSADRIYSPLLFPSKQGSSCMHPCMHLLSLKQIVKNSSMCYYLPFERTLLTQQTNFAIR